MSGTRKMPTYGINATECAALLDSVDWTDLESLATLTMLLCIDVVVIAGNTMVIMAVYYTSKLRSVTNLFIVSLAVADLMVGIAVLPFSATWEVFKVIFSLSSFVHRISDAVKMGCSCVGESASRRAHMWHKGSKTFSTFTMEERPIYTVP